ncbi:MAG: acyl-CoA dehydrogenase family protein [Pseudomonadota bacterium]
MDFELTQEQQLVRDSLERFVQDNYDLEARQSLAASKQGFSEQHWQQMAELGWLGLPFAESDGGFGGDAVDTMVVMEQFGRGLVLEPFLASVVLGGGALRRGGSATQRSTVLPGVIDGSQQLTLAYAEEQARFDLHDVTTTARAEGDGFVISGHKSMVPNAASASAFVVSARTSGGQIDTQGITLFLVPANAAGVTRDDFPTVDGLRASEISFDGVKVDRDSVIGAVDDGHALLSAVIDDGILAIAAEAVGAMEILYKDTVAYTQEREQFDHPLSDFQVVQHRLVEMFMEYEQVKSLLYRATLEAAQHAPTAQRTIHALKHLVGKTGTFIGENAVQLHGGMGMTEELRVGHYFKRLLVIDQQFGDADFHLQQFAA